MMDDFLVEKRACGFKCYEYTFILRRFDTFLREQNLQRCELPKSLSRQWLAKRPHQSAKTQSFRIDVVRQFAKYMCRMGYPADVPDSVNGARSGTRFSPRILTQDEIRLLIASVDQMKPTAMSSMRHLIMPEIFRLLYGCGLRLNEVLKLRVEDVDFVQGVLRINGAKFGKNRLVPPALTLLQRLQKYSDELGRQPTGAYFFPSPCGGYWSRSAVYGIFRGLLQQSHIPYRGKGLGPRVHDLRHTFCVHTLLRWYREGADLTAKLPVLSAYLGHSSIEATQYYLHLTGELFPEITARSTLSFGDVIPRWSAS
jgi:integrase